MTPEDVPPGPLLVDTDVATWTLLGTHHAEPFWPFLHGHALGISFATYGELLALAYRREWGEPRRSRWREHLTGTFVVVPYAAATAERWAPLSSKLQGHLHGGGANDLWTAAVALSQQPQLPIVTNNLGDFVTIAAECELQVVHPDLQWDGERFLRPSQSPIP